VTTGADAPGFAARLAAVRARIDAAARAVGRDPASVRLVGASKGVPADRLVEAVVAGLVDLGENRAQEMLGKVGEPGLESVRWHFIGRLQRNKVGALAPHVTVWHSVDRLELGAAVARHAPGARVFVQVALAPEPAKGGCAPDEVGDLVGGLTGLGLDVAGLMAVPPDDGAPRPWFARLAALAQDLALPELSMGMSGDVEDAVAEGATLVRVGTALFGPRPRP
jgi:pyridoxal phosphate enzyme (YggS family)